MTDNAYAGLRMKVGTEIEGSGHAVAGENTPENSASAEETTNTEETHMTETEHQDAVAAAAADATAAANARFSAVLASDHYAGNEPLAKVLLANDKLTADEIIQSLEAAESKAASEAAEAAAAEAARKEMQAALAEDQNSTVDPNGGGAGASAEDHAAGWDNAYAKTPGLKFKK